METMLKWKKNLKSNFSKKNITKKILTVRDFGRKTKFRCFATIMYRNQKCHHKQFHFPLHILHSDIVHYTWSFNVISSIYDFLSVNRFRFNLHSCVVHHAWYSVQLKVESKWLSPNRGLFSQQISTITLSVQFGGFKRT
jgi:hypothetical protein